MPFPLGLPCGRLALEQPGRDETQRLFHVPRSSQDGLGPLCTPAVRHSRRTIVKSPNLTAYHFGPSLDQPRWLVLGDDACECLISLTVPSDSSADTRIEASRLTTLPGRLQTLGSGLRRPPNACSLGIPAAKSRAWSGRTAPRQAVMNATSCRNNDPSSATRPTGRNDCNRDAMAGLDVMLG